MKGKLTYLACPYSHADPATKEARFEAANKASAKLMKDGHLVFSPISHTHPIALAGELSGDWHFWKDYDTAFIEASKELIVLKEDGWQESVGVQAEIKIAEELSIPVTYLEP